MNTTLSSTVKRKARIDAGNVSDTLTASDFTATTTSYTDFSGVSKTSGVVYAGKTAKTSTQIST